MDLPKPVFHSFYDRIVQNIHTAGKSVCKLSMKNAVNSEEEINTEKGDSEGLTVSGDGTWRKRGFSSLFGVSTVIVNYTGKVIDAIIKSRYCKSCEFWGKFNGTEEYYEWETDHEDECLANHEGSAGKMEVDTIIEIFARSEEQYGVKYTNYIGDGDNKTYKGIVDSEPYGDVIVKKKRMYRPCTETNGHTVTQSKERK